MVEDQAQLLSLSRPYGLSALMADQLSSLTKRGQSSAIVSSMRDSGERADDSLIFEGMTEADVRAGRASILLAHPEVIVSNKACRELLLSEVYQRNVVCVVADEAHCIVDW